MMLSNRRSTTSTIVSSFASRSSHAGPIRTALLATAFLAAVACGGLTEEGTPPTEGRVSSSSPPATSAAPNGSSNGTNAPLPPLPKGPISDSVATSDVSILMPLPNDVAGSGLLRADAQGPNGELLPRTVFETDLGTTNLDFESSGSGYDALRVVGVRLDPCSARSSGKSSCDKAEVRLVMQALVRDPAGRAVYADGGVHLIYDLPPSDLFDMLLEVLTAKNENGNLGSAALGPHPILTAQGLTGPFAERLRTIVLRHVGATRLVKATVFNHGNMDEDAWTFAAVEKVGGAFVKASIGAHRSETSQTVVGSSATGEITNTRASAYPELGMDAVEALVSAQPAPGSREALALSTAFEAAVRVENPTAHTTETTTCANCHLAEGARRIGEGLYAFQSTNLYRSPRTGLPVPAPRDERTSVTNLHAFGYLGRQVSVSQRTANESEHVAWTFALALIPR